MLYGLMGWLSFMCVWAEMQQLGGYQYKPRRCNKSTAMAYQVSVQAMMLLLQVMMVIQFKRTHKLLRGNMSQPESNNIPSEKDQMSQCHFNLLPDKNCNVIECSGCLSSKASINRSDIFFVTPVKNFHCTHRFAYSDNIQIIFR